MEDHISCTGTCVNFEADGPSGGGDAAGATVSLGGGTWVNFDMDCGDEGCVDHLRSFRPSSDEKVVPPFAIERRQRVLRIVETASSHREARPAFRSRSELSASSGRMRSRSWSVTCSA